MEDWGNPMGPKDFQAKERANNVGEPHYGSGRKVPAEGGPGHQLGASGGGMPRIDHNQTLMTSPRAPGEVCLEDKQREAEAVANQPGGHNPPALRRRSSYSPSTSQVEVPTTDGGSVRVPAKAPRNPNL